MKYAIVIEKTPTNYAAYVPDLPGCVATADTRDEVIRLMREGIPFHIEGLLEESEPVPEPQATVIEVDVPLAATA